MIRTILFDLDGTILDTNELIIQSFLHTFEGMGDEPLTREHIVPNMGRPLIEQMVYFSGREQVEDLVAKYREFNIGRHDELVTEFPYVYETLALLHAAGVKLGVVTSKIRRTTEMGLRLTGMYDYFGTIVTVEDVEKPKPDPEGIRRALRELRGDASTAIMVGDSHYDIEAAHNAGVQSVAVSWSLKGREYLKRYEPTHIIDDIREILPIAGVEGK
ncbi:MULTISPECIES: pyrophosphatase PpaX [unclassified Paenibacillus]|uniref:pyrophosphatase PpaX n=1 Tax=unclassified Paenibacillus TaxID=185978 RepID=UPI001AE187F5|nr:MULTISPECIES: pyrophosphatase PpaX [unclassified Paenibacillus]MBP1157723.1 pyrophosphatase PpaX [Paenibacillus sp. PvP091]MBP1171541.1 pyrophosphatase PpaX [Paenibacillus sp. PvR098]MBP2437922.1 pyrophosphatase PpaX [Paenibacillus sp. PvP052]